jgi:predicted ABC-type ATPase
MTPAYAPHPHSAPRVPPLHSDIQDIFSKILTPSYVEMKFLKEALNVNPADPCADPCFPFCQIVPQKPLLVLIVGPNGAGKTTLYKNRLRYALKAPFVNADEIQRDVLKDSNPEASYKAALMADEQRKHYLATGQSFIAETVFSHPSKLDILKTAHNQGFTTVVLHVGVETPEISIERVNSRIGKGGHPVPENKIRERFIRNIPLIKKALTMASAGAVFDNSRSNDPLHSVFTTHHKSFFLTQTDDVPDWVKRTYSQTLGLDIPQTLTIS